MSCQDIVNRFFHEIIIKVSKTDYIKTQRSGLAPTSPLAVSIKLKFNTRKNL